MKAFIYSKLHHPWVALLYSYLHIYLPISLYMLRISTMLNLSDFMKENGGPILLSNSLTDIVVP